jgi:hypothetical protein
MGKSAAMSPVASDDEGAQKEAIGGLLPLLDASDPALKARFYDEVGVEALNDPETSLTCGGGSCP